MGGTGAGGAGMGALPRCNDPGAGDVTGTWISAWISDAGEQALPADLTGIAIAVQRVEGDATCQILGHGDATGHFVVPGVPAGPYKLQIGGSYFDASARTLELGSRQVGRQDAVFAAQSAVVAFDVENLRPWAEGDYLEVASFGANSFLFAPEAGAPPAAGATRAQLPVDFSVLGANLIEARDRVWTTQLEHKADGAVSYDRLIRAAPLDPFTARPGTPARTHGTLAEVPLVSSITLDVKGAAYDALASAVHPRASRITSYVALTAQLDAASSGAGSPDLVVWTVPDTLRGDFTSGPIAYGNPYAPLAEPTLDVLYSYGVQIGLPGTSPLATVVSIYSEDRLSHVTGPITPTLSPPRDVRIGEAAPGADASGVGLEPTLRWSAPALGTPAIYVVTIYQLVNDRGVTRRRPIFSFHHTTGTALRIPPMTLTRGFSYYALVAATSSPGLSEARPYAATYPYANATALSPIFTP